MKYLLLAAAAFTGAASAQVGVSVSVGEPGFFGQIDIGGAPAPEVINTEPVVIQQGADATEAPLYLHVPAGYDTDWAHHCAQYNACGRPVLFVSDNWYNKVYVAHHQHPDRPWPSYHAARVAHVGPAHNAPVKHEEERHDH